METFKITTLLLCFLLFQQSLQIVNVPGKHRNPQYPNRKAWFGKITTAATMSNSIKFCALFLVNPWPSFKMHHFCHFQGPTGLEATGGPGGPSQPLQSIKID